MAEAMQEVRRSLGEDAIIVATRDEPDGGVRVTAAIEDTEPDFSLSDADLAAPPDAGSGHKEQVVDILLRHGVPSSVLDRMVGTAGCDGGSDLHAALAAACDESIAFRPLATQPWRKPVMLVGMPGAGKTTAVAKLAARALLKGLKPAVVTTDMHRAGAVEQLAALTRVMGLKLVRVEDSGALDAAIATLPDAQQIIIDTAGTNPFDPSELAATQSLVAATEVEPVLTLPAGSDAEESGEIASLFAGIGCARMVVTRLDVARRLGGIVSAAISAPLMIAEFGDTADIPDGLKPASAPLLADHLLRPFASQESAA